MESLEEEHLLLGQGLCLLLEVLLSQHQDVVLFLDDFLFILKVFVVLFKIIYLFKILLLLVRNFVFE